MPLYRVHLTSMAYVEGTIEVRAPDADEARAQAMANLGNIVWQYDGLAEGPDQGPEVHNVEEENET